MALIQRRASAPRREPRSSDYEVAQTDPWIRLADDQDVPAAGDVIVSMARLLAAPERLRAHEGRLGVDVPNDTPPDALAGVCALAALIRLELPTQRDGRAYSLAHWLRTRFAYRGELRAGGKVVRDQLAYLARVGFDSFELARGSGADALASLDDFSVHYQPAQDLRAPLWRRVDRGS